MPSRSVSIAMKEKPSNLESIHCELQDAISLAQASEWTLAVIVIHLAVQDVHEALGRRASEALLCLAQERWLAALEGECAVYSFGDGAFALLLPGATADVAANLAGRLLGVIDQPFQLLGTLVQVGANIGIAMYPHHGSDADTLVRHAEIAASEATRNMAGRAVYDTAETRISPERLTLAAELRHAIDQSQLKLRYQPQVDVRSGKLLAVEALVRWDHPHRGFLAPDEFIPIAEHLHLMGPLGRYVQRVALEQCRAWQSRDVDVRIGVNLSVHELQNANLADQISELLITTGIAPEKLCLEITESALLANPGLARRVLSQLRALGVRIAIDDFGTGYSSLAYLKDLPLDELKIDRSFVKDMAKDAGARAIVRSVIDLAHDLGLRAIAEGVEDRATQEVLATLGCDSAQGYYFSPPLGADDLIDWVGRDADFGLARAERAAADGRRRERCRKRTKRLQAEEEFIARKRAEEALRVSEARYRTVVDNIKDVIFQVDERQCWSFLNRAWEDMTGFKCDETLGQDSLDFVHPEDREIPFAAFQGIRAGSAESCRFELRFRTRTDQFRWVEAFATTVLDSAGRMIGSYGTLTDITERKQAEEHQRTLARTERLRALGQMASGVAHDMNQSLGLVAGYCDIAMRALEQKDADVSAVRDALSVITQAALDGGETVRRLLTFTRGEIDGNEELVDVASILHEVAALTAPRCWDVGQSPRKTVQVRVESHPGLLIYGRSGSLREALTNLVLNAIDAMPHGGTVFLGARPEDGQVIVTVADSGTGMSAEVQARIFEPFFSTKGERGTGLGLAQVFGIVQHHKAQIGVESAPGRGTTFRLTFAGALPAARIAETPVSKLKTTSRRLHILTVDDEPAMGNMIRRILRPDGHTVEHATTGEEAMKRLSDQSFDLLISDVGLGAQMNGWDLTAEVRRRHPEMPVVLATGWGAAIDPAEARMHGIHAVLSKPYRLMDLQNILAGLPAPGRQQEAA
jgi:PAS domain S-box-containing protein